MSEKQPSNEKKRSWAEIIAYAAAVIVGLEVLTSL
jgi:hypothetical protein